TRVVAVTRRREEKHRVAVPRHRQSSIGNLCWWPPMLGAWQEYFLPAIHRRAEPAALSHWLPRAALAASRETALGAPARLTPCKQTPNCHLVALQPRQRGQAQPQSPRSDSGDDGVLRLGHQHANKTGHHFHLPL